ncbi:inorganic pyrophosphatase [Candidatus Falkowbacteria bacterium CG10_big_fil_rev_8_21_14_0_10_39_11]|uniref:inorganic diphosphatase n=1 Tax=Candidatus Falkowbacteria bacterium CG10_big_fil_rev_8_21_14_0_10_39_11 TaxID=1974565 RepID=A0A2H0V424_9BACT|nr:MAG: inorganic pyrophosphatase [Candidatus Falkowbacteria bacterium CG10_big_fil_rev_8_21_14_0_10_39_11]
MAIKDYATKYLGQIIRVKMNRPMNSKHPRHGYVYEVNYGFVPETKAPDGGELDLYVLGVQEPLDTFTGKCIAVIQRFKDDDDKLIVVPEKFEDMSDGEIMKLIYFQEKWFESEIIR